MTDKPLRRFEPIEAGTLEGFVATYNEWHARGYHLVDFTFLHIIDGRWIGILENYEVDEQPADNSRVILEAAELITP